MVELVYKFDEKYVFTLLPAHASKQGKVIGFGVHIYIYLLHTSLAHCTFSYDA